MINWPKLDMNKKVLRILEQYNILDPDRGEFADKRKVAQKIVENVEIGSFEELTKKKILIVDDEYLVTWSLRKVLVKDYVVFTASKSEEALNLVNEYLFDLVITDIELEGTNGFSLIDAVRKGNLQTKFIVISAESSEGNKQRAKELNVDVFLEKPFNLDFVSESVEKLLNHEPRTKV